MCVQFQIIGQAEETLRKGNKKREAVTVSLFLYPNARPEPLVKFQDSHEGTLRNLDRSDLTHPLLTLLLLFKKFSLT